MSSASPKESSLPYSETASSDCAATNLDASKRSSICMFIGLDIAMEAWFVSNSSVFPMKAASANVLVATSKQARSMGLWLPEMMPFRVIPHISLHRHCVRDELEVALAYALSAVDDYLPNAVANVRRGSLDAQHACHRWRALAAKGPRKAAEQVAAERHPAGVENGDGFLRRLVACDDSSLCRNEQRERLCFARLRIGQAGRRPQSAPPFDPAGVAAKAKAPQLLGGGVVPRRVG